MTANTKSEQLAEITSNFSDNTVGAITPALLRSTSLDMVSSYQQAPGINNQSGVSGYIVQESDYGQTVIFNNAGGVAVTLSGGSEGFYPFSFKPKNTGAGAVTISTTTGTINGGATVKLLQNQATEVIADSAGNFHLDPPVSGVVHQADVFSGGSFQGTIAGGSSVISGGTFSSGTLISPSIDSPLISGGTVSSATIAGGLISDTTSGPLAGQVVVSGAGPLTGATVSGTNILMMGFGAPVSGANITPQYTSRARIGFGGEFELLTSGTYAISAQMYGTLSTISAAPSGGQAALNPTLIGGLVVASGTFTSGQRVPFYTAQFASAGGPGNAAWFDLGVRFSSTGVSGSIVNADVDMHEL